MPNSVRAQSRKAIRGKPYIFATPACGSRAHAHLLRVDLKVEGGL